MFLMLLRQGSTLNFRLKFPVPVTMFVWSVESPTTTVYLRSQNTGGVPLLLIGLLHPKTFLLVYPCRPL